MRSQHELAPIRGPRRPLQILPPSGYVYSGSGSRLMHVRFGQEGRVAAARGRGNKW